MILRLGILTITGLLLSSASYAQTVFRWGVDEKLYHQIKVIKIFKERIEKQTNGRVQIELKTFDAKDEKLIDSDIASNIYEIGQSSTGNYVRKVPQLAVLEIPFLFESEHHLENYWRSERVSKHLAQLESNDVIPVGFTYAGGFLNFVSTKNKMTSFSEFQNKSCYFTSNFGFFENFISPMNIKKTESEDVSNCFELLASEVDYLFMQQNAHDLVLNITNHRVVSRVAMVSKKAVNKLSKDDRELFLKEIKKIAHEERQLAYDGAKIATDLVKHRGVEVNEWSEKDFANERSKFKAYTDKYKAHINEEVEFIEKLNKKKSSVAKK